MFGQQMSKISMRKQREMNGILLPPRVGVAPLSDLHWTRSAPGTLQGRCRPNDISRRVVPPLHDVLEGEYRFYSEPQADRLTRNQVVRERIRHV